MKFGKCIMTGVLSIVLAVLMIASPSMAGVSYLPQVTEEMSEPQFWTRDLEDPDQVLADREMITALNQAIRSCEDCNMTDLSAASMYFHEKDLIRSLWAGAMQDASSMVQTPHYDMDNQAVTGPDMLEAIANVGGEDAVYMSTVQYGIGVKRTDILALPTKLLASDVRGNQDFNDLQLSILRVNEPVIIKAVSADGAFYYGTTSTVSGWMASEDVAICEDKDEWLSAWSFPEEEAIVVTTGKVYLECSNNVPESSLLMLPMGTVLRRASAEEYRRAGTKRSLYQNYPVWIPIRNEDGSYGKTIALISQNRDVNEGYLPLTASNILRVAFSKLGDIYGWGSMLESADCSNYIRDIYQCFGLEIPRNTTWQSAMPVYKYDVSETNAEDKKAVLDTLPIGSILIFNGHEMMYLGHVDDDYYVVSSVSGVKDFESDSLLTLGGVMINTLDMQRMSGLTWLESIHTMLVPYQPADENGPIVIISPDPEEEEEVPKEPVPVRRTMEELRMLPLASYTLEETAQVEGRQGVAAYGGDYYVSGTDALYRYNSAWELVDSNTAPFEGIEGQVNHLGDIDICNGEIYAPVEWFEHNEASSVRIAVYDAQTLTFSRAYETDPQSGQNGASGIAVDTDNYIIWLCSFAEGEDGRYLYKYNLDDGVYLGRVHLQAAPSRMEGIVYHDGFLYMTADDGDAALGEADHVYKWQVDKKADSALLSLEMTLNEGSMNGEAEGLSFTEEGDLLICRNYGAKIEDGQVTGYYKPYDKENHEVLRYHTQSVPYIPDYSDEAFWVARPTEEAAEDSYDVFMLEPATNMKNLSIGNENILNQRTISRFLKTFLMEKDILGEKAEIYCPLYRQKLFGMYYQQDENGEQRILRTLEGVKDTEAENNIAYGDVREAFLWFLDHREASRPFLLFGYSEGAEMVIRLLEEFGEDPGVSDQLIAAYAIGWNVTVEDLQACPYLKMAQSADDTGVIVSFECYDEKAQKPDYPVCSINPLNWKTDDTPAGKEENLGYVMVDSSGEIAEEIPEFCGAYLDPDTGVLIATDLDDSTDWFAESGKVMSAGDYHIYELNFFYRNLQENILQRVTAFSR